MAHTPANAVRAFRKTFTFASKDATHYFPGHMTKGMNQMQQKLKDVDCILEVHDCRIPYSGRNPRFSEVINVRPHILVLNKCDLGHLPNKDKMEIKLKQEGIKKVVYTNCKAQTHHTVKRVLIPTILDVIHQGSRFNRSEAEDYNLLVIGVPNVGKSSLINALRRTHKKQGKVASVGAVAGITRSVMEKIKICDRPPIYLYDTPGIQYPNITDPEVGMKLALCATLQDHLVGEDIIADYMLYWLNKHEQYKYVKHFGLEEPTDNILKLLGHVAKRHNLTQKHLSLHGGGYKVIPNFREAAIRVLKAFRIGKLGKVNLDIDDVPSGDGEE